MYLYLGSSLFFIYFLSYLVRSPTSYDNVKVSQSTNWTSMPPYYLHPWIINYVFILASFQSHGSGFLRQGAFVFGIGSFIYHLLEFITYFIIDLHPNCMDVLHTVNSFLSIIFVILQVCIFIRNFFHPN